MILFPPLRWRREVACSEIAVGDDGTTVVESVGVDAVGDDRVRVGEAVGVDAVGKGAVGDDGVRVGETVVVNAVGNAVVGDDGARLVRLSRSIQPGTLQS